MKIASIDKHPIIRSGLSIFLKGRFCDVEVLESECICAFQKNYRYAAPDVIIIGLAEEEEGIDLIELKKMMKGNPNASFVIYAGRPQYDLAISCMRIGVKGYLLKTNELDELVQCMETVMTGGRYLCNEFADKAINECLELVVSDMPPYVLTEN